MGYFLINSMFEYKYPVQIKTYKKCKSVYTVDYGEFRRDAERHFMTNNPPMRLRINEFDESGGFFIKAKDRVTAIKKATKIVFEKCDKVANKIFMDATAAVSELKANNKEIYFRGIDFYYFGNFSQLLSVKYFTNKEDYLSNNLDNESLLEIDISNKYLSGNIEGTKERLSKLFADISNLVKSKNEKWINCYLIEGETMDNHLLNITGATLELISHNIMRIKFDNSFYRAAISFTKLPRWNTRRLNNTFLNRPNDFRDQNNRRKSPNILVEYSALGKGVYNQIFSKYEEKRKEEMDEKYINAVSNIEFLFIESLDKFYNSTPSTSDSKFVYGTILAAIRRKDENDTDIPRRYETLDLNYYSNKKLIDLKMKTLPIKIDFCDSRLYMSIETFNNVFILKDHELEIKRGIDLPYDVHDFINNISYGCDEIKEDIFNKIKKVLGSEEFNLYRLIGEIGEGEN